MYLLDLDSEQMMIIAAAMDASNAILKARLHRVDPDQVISNSAILQEHKIAQLREQIELGRLSGWRDYNPDQKAYVLQLAGIMHTSPEEEAHRAAFEELVKFILSQRTKVAPLLDGRT